MNAEQVPQATKESGEIDGIALEALGSAPLRGDAPCAEPGRGGEFIRGQASTIGFRDGRLQFIAEPVEGQPIDEYCNSHNLELQARIKLFIQVCHAVHFGHQRGLIHRDLKPAKILVTAGGEPNLIGGDLDPLAEFSSPEQVIGEAVTTASDIYSLGVILYVLLTGRQPYRLKTEAVAEVLQAIYEQIPENPSEIAAISGYSQEQLRQILRGDMDQIVAKAMRKEPETRYGSADQFADLLVRYLEDGPVERRGSKLDRTVRFLRRNATAAIVCGLLISAAIGALLGAVSGMVLSRRDRNRALDTFQQAREAVDQLYTRVSNERRLDQPGLKSVRAALLKDAQQFYQGFLNQRGGDPTLRAELASANSHIAQISSVTDSTTDALNQFHQAVARWESLVAAEPGRAYYREELARTLNEQARVLMRLEDRGTEAGHILRRARDLIDADFAESHSVSSGHELGTILLGLGEVERATGQPEEAIKSLERAMAIESQLAIEDSRSLDPPIALAKGHALLGQILAEESEGFDSALLEYQQAVTLLEKVTSQNPELTEQLFALAFVLGDLSHIQQLAGKLDSALSSARQSLEILERLNREHPGILNYEEGLASIYEISSDLHRLRDEPADALAFAQKAQKLLEGLFRRHSERADLRLDLAKSQNKLGRLLEQTGEPVEALRSFQRAIDLYESLPERDARNSYYLATNVALSIPLIGVKTGTGHTVDPSKLSKGERLRREYYSKRAIDLLRRSVEGGFLTGDELQSDSDLSSIRDRPDFQLLVDEKTADLTETKK